MRPSITAFSLLFFFFNDPATTEIYTLSLHDALPICARAGRLRNSQWRRNGFWQRARHAETGGIHLGKRGREVRRHHRDVQLGDRKSTRLNSSHVEISYAVFCLKKKKKKKK